jgi:hypothetical protein
MFQMEYEPLISGITKAAEYTKTGASHISSYIQSTIRANPDAFYWFKLPDNFRPPSFRECVVGTADSIASIHPNYWLVAILSIFCFFILYIKMRFPFWNQVAALHTYDWHRRYLYSERPYMIRLLPNKTRYYEPKLIQTGYFRQLSNEQIQGLVTLLQNNYIPSDRMFSSFEVPSFAAYFTGHSHPPIISIFNEIVQEYGTTQEIDETQDIKAQLLKTQHKNINGFLTSRPVSISVKNKGTDEMPVVITNPAYFADFLCIRREVATPLNLRKLFSTHEYNQRALHPAVNITLFKKEVDLCEGLVPLVEYDVHTFYLPPKIRTPRIPQNFQIVRIQREYLHHLHDFVKVVNVEPSIRLSIMSDIGSLINLLRTNQLYAYALRGPEDGVTNLSSESNQHHMKRHMKVKLDTVYAIYFFRNEQLKYDDLDGSDTLHSIAAFCNTNNSELYFTGFLLALKECIKDMGGSNVRMLMIDDLGHLQSLLRRWMHSNTSTFKTRCAYYTCNYVVPKSPINAENTIIL